MKNTPMFANDPVGSYGLDSATTRCDITTNRLIDTTAINTLGSTPRVGGRAAAPMMSMSKTESVHSCDGS